VNHGSAEPVQRHRFDLVRPRATAQTPAARSHTPPPNSRPCIRTPYCADIHHSGSRPATRTVPALSRPARGPASRPPLPAVHLIRILEYQPGPAPLRVDRRPRTTFATNCGPPQSRAGTQKLPIRSVDGGFWTAGNEPRGEIPWWFHLLRLSALPCARTCRFSTLMAVGGNVLPSRALEKNIPDLWACLTA